MKHWVFCIETYLNEFLDPKNVHFDTNIMIIAPTEAKIWSMVYYWFIVGGHFENGCKKNSKGDLTRLFG